jgi:hypothetical protein
LDHSAQNIANDPAKAIADGIIPPGPLWKYMSLSANQTPTWQQKLKQICIEGKIYCAEPRDFNDPFDCAPLVCSPSTSKDIEAGSLEVISKFVNSFPDSAPEYIELEARRGLLSLSPEELLYQSAKACERTASRMGIFCLSERVDSVLMWSHYANNHTGIALRFEPMADVRAGLMPLLKVRYQEDRPTISYFNSNVAIDFTDALATKALFWEYEREWRKIVAEGAGNFAQFDPSLVTGLVFGVNCPQDLRDQVLELLQHKEIDFSEARPSNENFEIIIIPLGTQKR